VTGPARRGPLHGVKVVELAGIGPGPFAAMLLADLGADVVRVDRVGRGSPLTGDPRHDLLNRGKRSVAVDLRTGPGRELVLALAGRADALVEGYRPGVAERLGVGPIEVLARNPRLVYARMTGWGQDGPLAAGAGHDITYLAITGALHAIGRAGGPPQVPLNLVGDFGGGSLYLVVGLLAALHEAARSGRGQVVDAAVTDGAAHLTTMFHGFAATGLWQDERGVNLLDTGAPFYDVYPASDGRYLAVGALEPQFYAEFVRLLDPGDDLPEQYDRARWPQLRARIAAAFATRTRDEWAQVFEGTDACVAPVLSLGEAPAHPHLAARGTFERRGEVVQPAAAPRFSRTPTAPGGPPPAPGEHLREVLADWDIDDPATAP
jgi:alpha-methylacyl-CoA racemase